MAARFHLIAAIAATAFLGAAAAAAEVEKSGDLPNEKWWEKVTVTVASEDEQPVCTFSSSHQALQPCDIEAKAGALAGAGPEKGQVTKVVFERRFEPGAVQPQEAELAAGEMLLGGQVLKLAIDGSGKVSKCDVVSTAGDLKPDYGCAQAVQERFAAGAGGGAAQAAALSGYMTVLIYAHSEQVA
jgi:hypothetical protein